MPQIRPASGGDQAMILHFLFAVKGEVTELRLSGVDDARVPAALDCGSRSPFGFLRVFRVSG